MRKRAPSARVFAGRSPDFQRDMLHYLTTVVCSENRPKAGKNTMFACCGVVERWL